MIIVLFHTFFNILLLNTFYKAFHTASPLLLKFIMQIKKHHEAGHIGESLQIQMIIPCYLNRYMPTFSKADISLVFICIFCLNGMVSNERSDKSLTKMHVTT